MSLIAFDARTAYLLLGLMCLVGGLANYVALRVQLRRGHLQWVLGSGVFGLACLLLSLRAYIPDVLSYEGMFVGLIGGLLLQGLALWDELDRRWHEAIVTLLLAMLLAGYAVLRRADPSHGLAFALACLLTGAGIVVHAALAVWRRRRQAGALVIASAYLILVSSTLVRLWFVPGSLPGVGPLDANLSQVGVILGGFITVILAQVGYLGLQFDRMVSQRVASEREVAVQTERARLTAQRESELRELLAERNEFIQRLARSEAAEDLAQFATGLPHELSQPLGASQLNLETLEAHLQVQGPDAPARGAVRALMENNERMRRLLQQLRILLRTHEEAPRDILDLCVLVDRTLPVMQAAFSDARASLHADLPDAPVILEGSSTQLQQVLLILCTHVLDAIRVGGLDDAVCTVHMAKDPLGRHAVLSVTGTRAGAVIPCRPGAGLTIAQRIAQIHQGVLETPAAGGFRLRLQLRPPQ